MFPRNENRKRPFYLPVTLFGVVRKRVVSKRVVSADVPPEPRVRSPKPPFYETALLSPSDCRVRRSPSVFERLDLTC